MFLVCGGCIADVFFWQGLDMMWDSIKLNGLQVEDLNTPPSKFWCISVLICFHPNSIFPLHITLGSGEGTASMLFSFILYLWISLSEHSWGWGIIFWCYARTQWMSVKQCLSLSCGISILRLYQVTFTFNFPFCHFTGVGFIDCDIVCIS